MDGDPNTDTDNGDDIELHAQAVADSPYDDDEELLEDEVEGEDERYAPTTDAAERLRTLVAYLATNLVDDPDAVEVEARQRGGSVFVSLRVPEEDLGKVIGRGGRIARAMRTALMITGSRDNVRASLDIED
ncbi:MAG: KH domain-containing protein [Thermomicrobiales bacterium]